MACGSGERYAHFQFVGERSGCHSCQREMEVVSMSEWLRLRHCWLDLRGDWDIAAVDDFAPEIEWVGFHGSIQQSSVSPMLLSAAIKLDALTRYTRH